MTDTMDCLPPPASEWSEVHQKYIKWNWSLQYQRWYCDYYVGTIAHLNGEGWAFLSWDTAHLGTSRRDGSTHAQPSQYPSRVGQTILGNYSSNNGSLYHERLDSSFHVRHKDFFMKGKVFSVLFSETAGSTATSYDDAISIVRFGEAVHSQVRRFIVVRQRREFCFAIPIFTYGGQGTRKPGVVASEHAIAYSDGTSPSLLPYEAPLEKDPICVVMNEGEEPLSPASRIFFGVHHPIQYNVKVKELGHVHPDHMLNLQGYWATENQVESQQDPQVTRGGVDEDQEFYESRIETPLRYDASFDLVSNPRAFFKKGRVFITLWARSQGTPEITWFAVVKPKSTHCICLHISTDDGSTVIQDSAAVIPVNDVLAEYDTSNESSERNIYIKVENDSVIVAPGARISFSKPYSVEYNIKIHNVGRVFGESVGLMEQAFAEAMGLTNRH